MKTYLIYNLLTWPYHSSLLLKPQLSIGLNFSSQGVKKIPVVPVSYREKIRVGRSEIIFLSIFFMVFSIISVTTDTILAAARNHPEKIGSHDQSR